MVRTADPRRRPSMSRAKSAYSRLHKTDVQAVRGVGYDVAVPSRTRRAFNIIAGLASSADRHQDQRTLGNLREICRAHDRQSSLFSGILDRAQDNIFGSSFTFIPACEDKGLEQQAEDYIGRRMEKELCDTARLNNFLDMGKLTLRAIWNDGDIGLVKRSDGSLMAFEADQIETPRDGNIRDKNITLGVEKDDSGRHIAYYVKQRGRTNDFGLTDSDYKCRRVPAQNMIRPAFCKRFGQTRGVPYLAAALSFGSRFDNYLDFESMQAEMNSLLGLKITREMTEQDRLGNPAGTEDNPDILSTYQKLQMFEPGMIFELLAGEDVGMIGAERPGENFEPYVITCCRIIGAAVGMPLELVMLDFSKTNYSSARASLSEARRAFKSWQAFLDRFYCMPWYRWQIARGIANKELPADPRLFKVETGWPAWEYVDPKKEAEGDVIAINSTIKSPQECIRQRGRNPKKVIDEIGQWKEMLSGIGIEYPRPSTKTAINSDKDQDDE